MSGLEEDLIQIQTFSSEKKDNFKKIRFSELVEESQTTNNTTRKCWGCERSFGAENADDATKKLFKILQENLSSCPPETLFRKIHETHLELFVKKTTTETRWPISSIENHIRNHMLYQDFMLVADIRNLAEMEKHAMDTVFKKDTETGEKDIDPKKSDAVIKLSDRKYNLLNQFLQGRKTS